MITKQKNIELIQDRLASTGNVEDIYKRYPYPVMDALIAKLYSDLWDEDPESLQDMALEYTLTLSTDSGYYSNLTVRPVGSSGIVWVEGGGEMIPVVQGGMEGKILAKVEPGGIPRCRLVNGSKIVFDSKPMEPLTAMMIPDYSDLDDDDNVVMMGADSKIYLAILEVVRRTDKAPEEFYNDGRDDYRRVQKKNEFLSNRQ